MGCTWKELAVDLFERCRKAEEQYPGLALNLIEVFPARKMSHHNLAALIAERWGHPPDVECEFLPNDLVARFYGDLSGYGEFQQLGHELYSWLCATDPELQAKDSYYGWLQVLYDITRCCPPTGCELAPSPFVVNIPDNDDMDTLYGVTDYIHSAFEISSTALNMFIEPYQTHFLRDLSSKIHLTPWQLACVFANPRILRLEPSVIVKSGFKNAMAAIRCNDPFAKPRFIQGPNFSGRLYLAGHLLRKIKGGSTSICPVLQDFEKNGWPEEIEVPESMSNVLGASGRDIADKLSEGQEGPLRIHFIALDSGYKISWEIVDAEQ